MKFTDGYWRVKDGILLYQASSVTGITYTDHTITVYASGTQAGEGKGGIGGITLTYTLFSPSEDVIGVRLCHHDGELQTQPSFIKKSKPQGRVFVTEEMATLISGKSEVRVSLKGEWKLEFFHDGRYLTKSGWRSGGYAIGAEHNFFTGCFAQGRVKEELQLGIGEYVYGLGERFTPFIKNGQTVTIWNEDGGTSSEQSYKNIPFYITNKGYGVFVDDAGKVSFEAASEKVERVQFSVSGEALVYYVIGAPDMQGVLKRYTSLTGKPALPPAWSFGLWLTTSFTTDYDEKTVQGMIDGMREREIPLQVFHFDCFWMKGGQWCDFRWDETVFPDPEGMLQRLKSSGLKICVWINPYIAQRSELFREGKEKGYFIRCADGRIWQTDEWQPGMAIVDFTNPKAKKWYQEKLRRLIQMGVDTFKTDFGEKIPGKGVIYHDDSDPERMHNYYAYLYNQAVYDVLVQEKKQENAFVFARAATAGCQQFPVHWGGDCVASYESMAESLRGGLSLAVCGFGYWSHDMGGFENCATPDLYKRWSAFGMLSTHSRLHGNSSYRVPWLFDEEAVEVLRYFTRLKSSLMPYLYAQAIHTHETGIPMMQPLVMKFPEDETAPFIDRQYLLGESMLVAPVMNEAGECAFYVPKGEWTDLLNGKIYTQGWQKETYDYFSLPVLVKENSLLPMANAGMQKEETVYDYGSDITFHLFRLLDQAKAVVYRADASLVGKAEAVRIGNRVKVIVEGVENWKLCIRSSEMPKEVTGAAWERITSGILLIPECSEIEIVY